MVAFGAGAAAATLFVGVPELRSAEAASWASAIAAIAAVVVALWLASEARRRQRAERVEAGRIAFISLWPRLHRAQAQVSGISGFLRCQEHVPAAAEAEKLTVMIDALEDELGRIGASTSSLDIELAQRVTGAIALAGYVARQARRFTEPSPPRNRLELWEGFRMEWANDGTTATTLLLTLSGDAEAEANRVTRRASVAPSRDDKVPS